MYVIIVNVTDILYFSSSIETRKEKSMKNAMQRLNDLILQKNSRICAGFDPVWEDIPQCIKSEYDCTEESFWDNRKNSASSEVLYEYGIRYIDAIYKIVPAIKMNSAFFEQYQAEEIYRVLAQYANTKGLFVIGDVKRGDIGSTAKAYAEAYLYNGSPFDAITIQSYFGSDGVMPFAKMAKENGKGVFVLVKTSNASSSEFQDELLPDKSRLYDRVADQVIYWGESVDSAHDNPDDYNMVGAVVGATFKQQAEKLGKRMSRTFFLVPGYGAQGATATDVAVSFNKNGLGAIVNSSRGIMHAYKNERWKDVYFEEIWEEASAAEARIATDEINKAINKYYEKDIC